jgi:hypothetical protein
MAIEIKKGDVAVGLPVAKIETSADGAAATGPGASSGGSMGLLLLLTQA